ncbi:hypothetical protein NL501_28440, partial [Klebsiella pneumoniae]|nr:hypothetical protein [Klebsiella pneumoniae]
TVLLNHLDNDINIIGMPIAKLRVKSDKPQANIHVRLSDVHPNGKKALITRGQFNINHHKSHEFPEALPIDEYVDVDFPLDVIGYNLPKG